MSNPSLIAEEDVRRVAQLARLELSEKEVRTLGQELSGIIGYVQKLDELDTTDVEATSHAVALPSKFREDKTHVSMPTDLGLRGAPERLDDGFGVPKIIE